MWYKLYIDLVKYSLFLADFNEPEFSRQFLKNAQVSFVKKIHPVWTVLFHADGGTGVTNLKFALHNCAQVPRISLRYFTQLDSGGRAV